MHDVGAKAINETRVTARVTVYHHSVNVAAPSPKDFDVTADSLCCLCGRLRLLNLSLQLDDLKGRQGVDARSQFAIRSRHDVEDLAYFRLFLLGLLSYCLELRFYSFTDIGR